MDGPGPLSRFAAFPGAVDLKFGALLEMGVYSLGIRV